MKVMGTGMCLLESENGAFGVGFRRKRGLGAGSVKCWPFLVWTSQNRGSFSVNFAIFSWKLNFFFEMLVKHTKHLKFNVEILNKGGHWMRTVVKNRFIGCKICAKKGGLLTGRWLWQTYGSAPPPLGLLRKGQVLSLWLTLKRSSPKLILLQHLWCALLYS